MKKIASTPILSDYLRDEWGAVMRKSRFAEYNGSTIEALLMIFSAQKVFRSRAVNSRIKGERFVFSDLKTACTGGGPMSAGLSGPSNGSTTTMVIVMAGGRLPKPSQIKRSTVANFDCNETNTPWPDGLLPNWWQQPIDGLKLRFNKASTYPQNRWVRLWRESQ
ncbi:hypothetical protein [Caballeronia terrestris]|uniref:hypothetical protein n=1 Tax=Caballeronia terrestris TaxID=1226301 RepID=UPI001F2677F0|nr:hypothetical protein [Caballeronia terrestris]